MKITPPSKARVVIGQRAAPKAPPKPPPPDVPEPPAYEALADLLCELVEVNIANIDRGRGMFVQCFTFGANRAPDHWIRALAMREALIGSKLARRQRRTYDKAKVGPLWTTDKGKP